MQYVKQVLLLFQSQKAALLKLSVIHGKIQKMIGKLEKAPSPAMMSIIQSVFLINRAADHS